MVCAAASYFCDQRAGHTLLYCYFPASPFPYISLLRTKPHIAYLLTFSWTGASLILYIVRGIKNQRPRQPVPSTLLALTKCARRTNLDRHFINCAYIWLESRSRVFSHRSGYDISNVLLFILYATKFNIS